MITFKKLEIIKQGDLYLPMPTQASLEFLLCGVANLLQTVISYRI